MRKRVICVITISLVIIIWGLYKCGIALFDYNGVKKGKFNAEIVEYQKSTKYTDVYKIKMNKQFFFLYVKRSKTNVKKCSSEKEDLSYYESGDLIQFNGEFSKPDGKRNEGGFDYKLYLKTRKISGLFFASDIKKVGKNNSINAKWKGLINKIRKGVAQNYINNLEDKNAGLISALTIGDKANVEKEAIQEFRDASLSHILAISGAHFSYIILMIGFVNKALKKKRLGQILLILTMLFFMQLTGNTASVVRAGIMCVMITLSSMCYRKNDFLTTLSVSLLVQIIYNPYVIFDIGLLLSYFGTIGIVYFYKIVNSKIKLKILSITLAANIMIFPIMVYYFNTFSLSFVISNFFASILLGPIVVLGIISNVFRFKIVFIILNFLLIIFRKIVSICAKLPLSKIYVITPNFMSIIFYYSILIIIWNVCSKKNRAILVYDNEKMNNKNCKEIKIDNIKSAQKEHYGNLNNVKLEQREHDEDTNNRKSEQREHNEDTNNRKSEQRERYWDGNNIVIKRELAILMILIVVFNLNFQSIFYTIKGNLLINFVDVGQGDCTLIRYNGNNILVDGGGNTDSDYNVGEKVLLPYLLDKKIKKIDYIIFSHFDTDHCQGLIYLMGKLKIKNAVIGLQADKYDNYKKFLIEAKNNKINVIAVKKGDRLNIDKNLFFDVIWPDKNKLIMDNSINNNSLVCKLHYYNFKMLFTGDIEKEAEEAILGSNNSKTKENNRKIRMQEDKNEITLANSMVLNATILKVAHHGSNTSSTQEFIDAVNPHIALIGVGKNNKFKHPSQSTIEKLNKKKCRIYRTDNMGEIFLHVNKKGRISIKITKNM